MAKLSTRLSVRVSVTLLYCVNTTQVMDREIFITNSAKDSSVRILKGF